MALLTERAAFLRRLIPQLVLFDGILMIDQITKTWALMAVRGRPPSSFLGDLIRLAYAENPGAFLGLGDVLSASARFWVLTMGVAVMLAFGMFVLIRELRRNAGWNACLVTGLTCVLSGGLSNLGDRMFRTSGKVVDFLNMGVGGLRTGIFNIADVAIMVGVGLLFLSSSRDPGKDQTLVSTPSKPSE